jgi:hypothetical protein
MKLTEQPGPLAIHEILRRHANEMWVPNHLDNTQAAAFVLDHFGRQIAAELALVTAAVKHKNY